VFLSNLVGDEEGAKLGAEVRALFNEITDEFTLPKFELTQD
jgi:hypothetical protein